MIIREEQAGDIGGVREVEMQAFGRAEEADLVDGLRREGAVLLSLIAEVEQRIVGHILFTRMWIETSNGSVSAVALAPMAVLPEYQRRGIGQRLVRQGLNLLRCRGERIVIIVGHPDYYPRFGFVTAKPRGIDNEYNAPEEAFMILELQPGAFTDVTGVAKYQPEWNGV